MKRLYSRCWNGEIKLWQAFWLVGLLGKLAALILVATLMALFVSSPRQNMLTYGFLVLAFLGYSVFASVSIWRSSGRNGVSPMGALARVLIFFYWVGLGKVVHTVNTLHSAS